MRIRNARLDRRWTLRQLAERSELSVAFIHAVEHGAEASLASYAAIAAAVGLRPSLELIDPRHRRSPSRAEDPVHAAMGDVIAARLLAAGLHVSLDEPFQHFQFAGRADLLAWDAERTALLHVENRTRFPNIGETFGSYNAKRRYMPSVIAERLGVRGGFRVVTNVIVALWASEVLHVVRRHRPSFSAICPHGPEQFAAWWSGQPPAVGVVSSSIILFDPVDGGRADRRRFVGLEEVPTVRPRYRGYADAVEALRRESQSTFHPE